MCKECFPTSLIVQSEFATATGHRQPQCFRWARALAVPVALQLCSAIAQTLMSQSLSPPRANRGPRSCQRLRPRPQGPQRAAQTVAPHIRETSSKGSIRGERSQIPLGRRFPQALWAPLPSSPSGSSSCVWAPRTRRRLISFSLRPCGAFKQGVHVFIFCHSVTILVRSFISVLLSSA